MAVVGAGVAGCALAAGLRRGGWAGTISLWERGRGVGGRAGSRRSRHDPSLRIDHGAPLLNLGAGPVPDLIAPLLEGGWIVPWAGPVAGLSGDGHTGQDADAPLLQGTLYRGQPAMDSLCQGLLALAEAAGPAPELQVHLGTLVRHLVPQGGGGWQLLDDATTVLGQADWLVLASTLLAHPRCTTLFDWPEAPLGQAARTVADPDLDRALGAIAALELEAGCSLLLTIEATAAAPWRALPFRLLEGDGSAQRRWGLRQVLIQPQADGRCAVVAQASAGFAAAHAATPDATVIDTLEQALAVVLAPPLTAVSRRQLMRWGAAFPLPPGLPGEAMVCPASRVAFCGDAFEGPGHGRIEGALRSAQALAARLLALLLLGSLLLGLPWPAPVQAAAGVAYRCDGDLLLATADNGAVDAGGIPNISAGTVPGATMVLEWRGLHLQLPRTNNAGPPSYTDGVWWWSLEDPDHPRFLRRRGGLESFSCQPGPDAGSPAGGR